MAPAAQEGGPLPSILAASSSQVYRPLATGLVSIAASGHPTPPFLAFFFFSFIFFFFLLLCFPSLCLPWQWHRRPGKAAQSPPDASLAPVGPRAIARARQTSGHAARPEPSGSQNGSCYPRVQPGSRLPSPSPSPSPATSSGRVCLPVATPPPSIPPFFFFSPIIVPSSVGTPSRPNQYAGGGLAPMRRRADRRLSLHFPGQSFCRIGHLGWCTRLHGLSTARPWLGRGSSALLPFPLSLSLSLSLVEVAEVGGGGGAYHHWFLSHDKMSFKAKRQKLLPLNSSVALKIHSLFFLIECIYRWLLKLMSFLSSEKFQRFL